MITSVTIVLFLRAKWSQPLVLQLHSVGLQLMLLMGLLIICPSLRAWAATSGGRLYSVLAVRHGLEAAILLLAFCAIPGITLAFVVRSSREDEEERKQKGGPGEIPGRKQRLEAANKHLHQIKA